MGLLGIIGGLIPPILPGFGQLGMTQQQRVAQQFGLQAMTQQEITAMHGGGLANAFRVSLYSTLIRGLELHT